MIEAHVVPGSPIPKPSLSALYAVPQPGDKIGGRVLQPQWINPNLPGLWKSNCSRLHRGLCQSVPNKSMFALALSWLVDAKGMCLLIPAPRNCSYVALSYVWGFQKTLLASLSNIDRLQEKGSLSLDSWGMLIPTTVRDAMGVVELLAEKYLWVDTLCIIQNDELQKHAEMSKMSSIYANASVTIMAIQGEQANSGLKGFQRLSKPRNLRQGVQCLKGGVKVTQYPVPSRYFELGIDSPVWETREGTFQEKLFSRRRLVSDRVLYGGSVRLRSCANRLYHLAILSLMGL